MVIVPHRAATEFCFDQLNCVPVLDIHLCCCLCCCQQSTCNQLVINPRHSFFVFFVFCCSSTSETTCTPHVWRGPGEPPSLQFPRCLQFLVLCSISDIKPVQHLFGVTDRENLTVSPIPSTAVRQGSSRQLLYRYYFFGVPCGASLLVCFVLNAQVLPSIPWLCSLIF